MESLVVQGAINLESSVELLDRDQSDFAPVDFDPAIRLARAILKKIHPFRRLPTSDSVCRVDCTSCQAPHLPKIAAAIRAAQPIQFVLPAFPGKSPNPAKVLGPLPDMAEQLALQFLEQLCDRIAEIYAPGAHILLCSDGRVFSDVVGMRESDITAYQRELDKMIGDLGLARVSTFNLDVLYDGDDYVGMRRQLMEEFGATSESLRAKVLSGDQEAQRMYCGITRFLVEDSTFPGQTRSRASIQKECKARAYEVIRRSNAWSELIARQFPDAVRLSIHPQTCGAEKLGIRLIGTESWMTPWHGVAVKTLAGFMLLKRTEAEALGARLVQTAEGRPSHFEI